MKLVQLTPGTGGMYCGNCFRDNALVAELRRQGHEALMVPLYLPLTLDETDESTGTPIFFGGINVYLEQKFAWFRAAPGWVRTLLSKPSLLARAAGHSAKTRAEDVGDILLSMLKGEEGRQARELQTLVDWLKRQPKPDAVGLSNALLLGLARTLKTALGTRVLCFLQGEDSYLDSLAPVYRAPAWDLLRRNAAHVDLFIAPNAYFAKVMGERLGLPPEKVRRIPDGLHLEGYDADASSVAGSRPPTLGYFARLCPEKGLHVLVDAYIDLCRRRTLPGLQLKVGGGLGPGDREFVAGLKRRLEREGVADTVSWHPNLDREQKIHFLRSLDVFSVPATYPEAFGMYLAEALAAGVPVVQPRFASFPEFVELTGGGALYDADRPGGLADALEALLLDPGRARALGRAGQEAVHARFSARRMATDVCAAVESLA